MRRGRKTRYRECRFDNRLVSKRKGWLAPSIIHKINCHLAVVDSVCKLLPISKITAEVASFDIQKIKNPEISDVEYSQGEQMGSWNVREYVLFRDNHTCQCCKGKSGDKVLNVHHIESRRIGGNAPNNLITLCKTCHANYHEGRISLPDSIRRGKSFRDAAFMGIMRWSFYDKLKAIYQPQNIPVNLTYGYLTKHTRISNNLPKEHYVDARCISGNPTAKSLNYYFYQKKVRCHNRQIHKHTISKGGYRKLNQASKYVFGYQLFDKVIYQKQECFIFGRRSSGRFDIRLLDGTKINASVSYKKLKLQEARNSYLIEKRIIAV